MALEPFSDYVDAQNSKYKQSLLITTIACPVCAALPEPQQNPLSIVSTLNGSPPCLYDSFICLVCNNNQTALSNP